MEGRRPQYEKIQTIGAELLQEARNYDTAYVSDILENVALNWRTLESLLNKR